MKQRDYIYRQVRTNENRISLLSSTLWWSCGTVILEQEAAVSLGVQARPVWNTSTGNSEQTSLLCLWSRVKDAKETTGSFRTSHGRKPERDLGTKLPPKCECACSVFQCTVSEAWWENWRVCGNLEFGDFGLFLLTTMVFESYQCELSEICFLSENGIICWFSKLHRKIKKAWAI